MVKIDDIINVEFSRAFMGYDMKEVDSFLDAVIEQMEAFENERKEMLTALEYLLREIEQYEQEPSEAQKRVADRRTAAQRQAREAAESLRSSMGVKGKESGYSGPETTQDGETSDPPAMQQGDEAAAWAATADAPQMPGEEAAGVPAAQAAGASEEDENEIPTYVFAGMWEEAEEDAERHNPQPAVAEEFELGDNAPLDGDAAFLPQYEDAADLFPGGPQSRPEAAQNEPPGTSA